MRSAWRLDLARWARHKEIYCNNCRSAEYDQVWSSTASAGKAQLHWVVCWQEHHIGLANQIGQVACARRLAIHPKWRGAWAWSKWSVMVLQIWQRIIFCTTYCRNKQEVARNKSNKRLNETGAMGARKRKRQSKRSRQQRTDWQTEIAKKENDACGITDASMRVTIFA